MHCFNVAGHASQRTDNVRVDRIRCLSTEEPSIRVETEAGGEYPKCGEVEGRTISDVLVLHCKTLKGPVGRLPKFLTYSC